MEKFEKYLFGGMVIFFSIVIIIALWAYIHDPPNPIPLREVTVCGHINTTATQCYKYWAHIGPGPGTY